MLFKFKLQLRGGATSTSRVVWSSQASYEPEACISGYIYVLASPSAVNLNPGRGPRSWTGESRPQAVSRRCASAAFWIFV